MKWICLRSEKNINRAELGGKAAALLKLSHAGYSVPSFICLKSSAYEEFVEHNQLREKINLELYRKDLSMMRWEEIWDTALRIQSFFLSADFPQQLKTEIIQGIRDSFGLGPLAIRSSGVDEDGKGASFAGLHASYLNVVGISDVLHKIKKVWASLWSDRAILYRQELGLIAETSTMAVIIQELVEGQSSGVMFTKSPANAEQIAIESIYGLNQALVDGLVEPDRWFVSRESDRVEGHFVPESRKICLVSSQSLGLEKKDLSTVQQKRAPLSGEQISLLAKEGIALEEEFGYPLDIEWTIDDGKIYILQSRPITATPESSSSDKRQWYLSLTRSFENLMELWKSIEETLLPEMAKEAEILQAMNIEAYDNESLAKELRRRVEINDLWVRIYWDEFIPFAHGARLFGEIYNDVMVPEDPFAFVSLLIGQENMLSVKRNKLIYLCANIAENDETILEALRKRDIKSIENAIFQTAWYELKAYFAMGADAGTEKNIDALIASVILEYCTIDEKNIEGSLDQKRRLEKDFLLKAEGRLAFSAEDLLAMARASYKIRDDDNIYIGRIASELDRAKNIACERLTKEGRKHLPQCSFDEIAAMLQGESVNILPINNYPEPQLKEKKIFARQLQGQAASAGVARGKARIIFERSDLQYFKKGEILIIDVIDPTMTYFAPLAGAIVERRGGMLIHGAIIAREYGIPCIVGVTDVTDYIQTGDEVTVDGYLGICTINTPLRGSKKI